MVFNTKIIQTWKVLQTKGYRVVWESLVYLGSSAGSVNDLVQGSALSGVLLICVADWVNSGARLLRFVVLWYNAIDNLNSTIVQVSDVIEEKNTKWMPLTIALLYHTSHVLKKVVFKLATLGGILNPCTSDGGTEIFLQVFGWQSRAHSFLFIKGYGQNTWACVNRKCSLECVLLYLRIAGNDH